MSGLALGPSRDVRDDELLAVTVHAKVVALLPFEQRNLVSRKGNDEARSRTPIPSELHALLIDH